MNANSEGGISLCVEDLYAVVSSWLACKDTIPEGWKTELGPIKAMACTEVRNIGMTGRSNLLSRARRTMLKLMLLSHTLSELTSAIQVESEAAQANFKAVRSMCGLASLPAELLACVFDYVVSGDPNLTNPSRWKAAVTLSHVCRYFRDMALSRAHLWVNISCSGDMAASCLLRSKDVPLDVELAVAFEYADPDNLSFERLFLGATSHSKRWRRLDVQFLSNLDGDGAVNRTPLSDPDVRQTFRSPYVPLLESLLIRNNKPANALYTNYSEFAHWNTPSLRHISAVHYFPLSLPNLENLTTLDITLILNQIDFAVVLKELSRMRALEDFALKLDNCSYPYVEPITIRNYKRTDLPSVRRLRIETELRKFDSGSSLLKRSLFSSLFFPGVIDLHVRLCGELPKLYPYSPNDSNSDTTLELAIEVMDIFRNIEQFLRVERFHLELHALCDALPNTAAWIGSQQGRISLFVPLNMLPSAKHISLQSNRSIVMPARNESKPEMRLVLATLETITIIGRFDTWDAKRWIKNILGKQKKRGEWEAFRELVFLAANDNELEAGHTRKGNMLRTYKGDAALAW